jgi:SAM-dependent MidA family methyltransferase
MGELLRMLTEAEQLPLPCEAQIAVQRGRAMVEEILQSGAGTALPTSVTRLRKRVVASLRAAIRACPPRLLLLKDRLLRLRKNGRDGGMDPFVRGVQAIAPDSRLVRSHHAARATFETLVRHADLLLAQPAAAAPRALLEHLARLVKTLELARAYAGRFASLPRRAPLGDDWKALTADGNMLDLLNRANYGLRGKAIYDDFATQVRGDPLLAQADAACFRRDLKANPSTDLQVLEVGVGGGQFAADFIACLSGGDDRLQVRYCIGDISRAMLDDALRHLARTDSHVEVLALDELAGSDRRFVLQRFNELFDDLPECAVLYVDGDGRLWTAEVRATFPGASPPGPVGGPPVPLHTLTRALQDTDLDTLRQLAPEDLGSLEVEVRFTPIQLTDLPYGDLLPALLEGARDRLFPYNVGAARFLEQCLDRAEPHGVVRIYDYGLPHCRAATRYEESAKVVRHFGANPTRDVLFSLLQAVAERRGWTTRLCSSEHFIHEALGQDLVDFGPLDGADGPLLSARITSGEDALLPLTALRHHAAIVGRAAQLGNDGSLYQAFIEELAESGAIDLGQPPNVWPRDTSLLEGLALDLSFSISAVFRAPAQEAMAEGKNWVTRPAALARIADRLERIGYRGDAVRTLFKEPPVTKFWVLECRAGAAPGPVTRPAG